MTTPQELIIPEPAQLTTEIVIHGFRLTATGLIPEGEPDYDAWERCGNWLRFAEKSVAFWIGDWIRYGENKWGETYAQAMDETGLEYQTLADAKYVAAHVDFSRRHENLTFDHHRQVAKMDPDEQTELLDKAEREGIKSKDFRDTVKEYKRDKKLAHLPAAPEWAGAFDLDSITVCAIENLELPPGSVDMIFTDPPYHEESLGLYDHLAQLARHVLKPGAYLMTYCGKMFLPQIHDALRAAGLEYVWEFCVFQPDSNLKIQKYHLFGAWRPILAYRKPGQTTTQEWVPDSMHGTRNKEFHEWGQQIEPPLKYINAYTLPGEIVLDPFIGGGTTAVACRQLGRHYIAFDKEESAVKMSLSRLNGNHQ